MAEDEPKSVQDDLVSFIDECVGDDVKNLGQNVETNLEKVEALQEDIKTQIDISNKVYCAFMNFIL